MNKVLITEQLLIDAINLALRNDCQHKDCHCQVVALKKVEYPERNWEVERSTTGGSNLLHTEECQRILDRVLNELVARYDVQWAE